MIWTIVDWIRAHLLIIRFSQDLPLFRPHRLQPPASGAANCARSTSSARWTPRNRLPPSWRTTRPAPVPEPWASGLRRPCKTAAAGRRWESGAGMEGAHARPRRPIHRTSTASTSLSP
jgi:hypothetical protein